MHTTAEGREFVAHPPGDGPPGEPKFTFLDRFTNTARSYEYKYGDVSLLVAKFEYPQSGSYCWISLPALLDSIKAKHVTLNSTYMNVRLKAWGRHFDNTGLQKVDLRKALPFTGLKTTAAHADEHRVLTFAAVSSQGAVALLSHLAGANANHGGFKKDADRQQTAEFLRCLLPHAYNKDSTIRLNMDKNATRLGKLNLGKNMVVGASYTIIILNH